MNIANPNIVWIDWRKSVNYLFIHKQECCCVHSRFLLIKFQFLLLFNHTRNLTRNWRRKKNFFIHFECRVIHLPFRFQYHEPTDFKAKACAISRAAQCFPTHSFIGWKTSNVKRFVEWSRWSHVVSMLCRHSMFPSRSNLDCKLFNSPMQRFGNSKTCN